MKVNIIVELTGTEQEADGYLIHGVYADHNVALSMIERLVGKGVRRDWLEIERHEVYGLRELADA